MQGKDLTDRLCKMGCLNQGITFDDYSTPFSFKIYNLTYCGYNIKIWCFKDDSVVFVSNTEGAGFEWKKEMDDNDEINKFMQWVKSKAVQIRYNNMEKDFVK
jgi:hypothetical protein